MPINDAEGRKSFCWELGYQKTLVTCRLALLIGRLRVRILLSAPLVHQLYTSAGGHGEVHLRTPITKMA